MKKRFFLLLVIILLFLLPLRFGVCEAAGNSTLPDGFVRVTTATQVGWLPLPTEGEYTYPLIQILPDGTTVSNIIHLLPNGVYMEESTCDNQDCVHEGLVTLQNRTERVLGNAILCLPNQVSLELFSLQEVYLLAGLEPETESSR